MATNVFFIGSTTPLRLADNYERVNSQLQGRESGEFAIDDENKISVTIYKSAIAYTRPAGESFVGAA